MIIIKIKIHFEKWIYFRFLKMKLRINVNETKH